MNDIASERRNSLKVNIITSFMFINLNEPVIGDVNPIPFVKSWLTSALVAGCRPHGIQVLL